MEGAAERPDCLSARASSSSTALCSPENVGRDLPLIVFFQGGPGGACSSARPRATGNWISSATRVVLPDQRCGRLLALTVQAHCRGARLRAGADPARRQAEYLKRFLADSIIRISSTAAYGVWRSLDG